MNCFKLNTLFKIAASIATALLLAACKPDQNNPTAATSPVAADAEILITHITTIDAASGLQPDTTVALRGNQIIQVAPSSVLTGTAGFTTIDGSGKYLIPGLWDAHIHLTFTPELTDSMFRLLIGNGVTSIRDTGGKLDLVLAQKRRAIEQLAEGTAPTVFVAGPLIDGAPGVYIGDAPGYPEIGTVVTSEAEVRAAVDDLVAQGVDLLKAYEMLDPAIFTALIDQAKKHGKPITGHVPLSMTVAEASNAGLDSMEHTRNMEMGCSSEEDELYRQRQQMLTEGHDKKGSVLRSDIHNAQHYQGFSTYDAERCQQLLALLAKNSTWQIPTLALMEAASKPFFIEDEWIATYQALPEPMGTNWAKASKELRANFAAPAPERLKRAEIADWKAQLIPMMKAAGIPIMAGTDAPIFFLTPGYSLHLELKTLVDAGLTPMDALAAATSRPAEYFGLEQSQGFIAPGMLADLVILNANPLDDIRNTQAIEMVIKNGIVLDRAELDAMLTPAAPASVE